MGVLLPLADRRRAVTGAALSQDGGEPGLSVGVIGRELGGAGKPVRGLNEIAAPGAPSAEVLGAGTSSPWAAALSRNCSASAGWSLNGDDSRSLSAWARSSPVASGSSAHQSGSSAQWRKMPLPNASSPAAILVSSSRMIRRPAPARFASARRGRRPGGAERIVVCGPPASPDRVSPSSPCSNPQASSNAANSWTLHSRTARGRRADRGRRAGGQVSVGEDDERLDRREDLAQVFEQPLRVPEVLDHVRADHDRPLELLGRERERACFVQVVSPVPAGNAAAPARRSARSRAPGSRSAGAARRGSARAGAEIDDPAGTEPGRDVGRARVDVGPTDEILALADALTYEIH